MITLEKLERQVLLSCYGFVYTKRQALATILPLFKIDANWLLLAWLYRDCPQYGRVQGWSFFFHGYECDLENSDGINIVSDIGSLGNEDAFSRWGVANFIGSAGHSRFVHPDLIALVRQESTGQHVLINQEPISIVCDRLLDLGYLEQRPGLRSIADIPEAIASKYSITEDSFIFSIRRECLALTARGMTHAASEH